MTKILTVEALLASSEKTVVLPLLSKALGEEQQLRFRRISHAEHLSVLPSDPPDSEDWPDEEFGARARAWFKSLPPDEQEQRRVQARESIYRIVAIAALEPRLTFEQARMLGDDATVAAAQVLVFSGLAPEAPERKKRKDKADGTAVKPGDAA